MCFVSFIQLPVFGVLIYNVHLSSFYKIFCIVMNCYRLIFMAGPVRQRIYSRTPSFDDSMPISTVDDVVSSITPPKFWLNIQVFEL